MDKLKTKQLVALMREEVLCMDSNGKDWDTENPDTEDLECLNDGCDFKTGEYTFECIESDRHNSDMWVIFKCNETGQFFKWMKYYNSWDSEPYDLEEVEEVEPVQVTITEYRKVKEEEK